MVQQCAARIVNNLVRYIQVIICIALMGNRPTTAIAHLGNINRALVKHLVYLAHQANTNQVQVKLPAYLVHPMQFAPQLILIAMQVTISLEVIVTHAQLVNINQVQVKLPACHVQPMLIVPRPILPATQAIIKIMVIVDYHHTHLDHTTLHHRLQWLQLLPVL